MPRGKFSVTVGKPSGKQDRDHRPPTTLAHRIAWGGFVSAAVLLTGLVSYTVWKAQLPDESAEDDVVYEELAATPEEMPIATEAEEVALQSPSSAGTAEEFADRDGAVLIADESGAPRKVVIEDLSGSDIVPQGKGNRQAVHFVPADESATQRDIERASFAPNSGIAKPAAWLSGTIEDAPENTVPRVSYDVSGSRHR